MELKFPSRSTTGVDLVTIFSDLVRLETELWDRVDRRLRRDHGLPLSWFEPMQVMDRVHQCRVADIAAALSITVGGTSKLVDRIERAGWCNRAPHPDDARSSIVTLTRTGRRLIGQAEPSFEDELEMWLGAALSPEHLDSLGSFLRRVREHIAHQRESNR